MSTLRDNAWCMECDNTAEYVARNPAWEWCVEGDGDIAPLEHRWVVELPDVAAALDGIELDPWQLFDAGDGNRSLRSKTSEELIAEVRLALLGEEGEGV